MGIQLLDDRTDLIIPAKIDGGIIGLEGVNAGIGKTVGIKFEATGKFRRDRSQALFNSFEAAGFPVDEIDRLDFRQDIPLAKRLANDRQDGLAESARLRQFDAAPR